MFKYKENAPKGTIMTIHDAIERLIIEKIRPNFEPAPWQVFRDEELWTRKVNLVFHDNEASLKKVFAKYASSSLNKVPFAFAIKMLTQDCSIKLDRQDATYCYGMSLSTCVDL